MVDHSYPREIIDEIWQLAEPIKGNDAALWRADEFGDRIQRQDYGKPGSPFGWGISEASPGRLKPLHLSNIDLGSPAPDRETDGLFSDPPELF